MTSLDKLILCRAPKKHDKAPLEETYFGIKEHIQ
jgi:hypothetical protein